MECPVCPIIRNHENEVKSILEKAVKNRPEINVAPFRLGFTSTPICKIKTPVGDDPLSLDDIERMFTKNFPSWNQDFLCFPEGPMFYDKLFKKEPYTRAIDIENKDWPIKKMTTFEFGHFTTIFGHFFANYIYIFHKTEVLMVILWG